MLYNIDAGLAISAFGLTTTEVKLDRVIVLQLLERLMLVAFAP